MATVTNSNPIGTTATTILTSEESSAAGQPIYLVPPTEPVTLVVGGSDPYQIKPGEPFQILPGQTVSGTSASGTAVVQIVIGFRPANTSATSGGGAAVYAGGMASPGHTGIWSVGQNDFTAVYEDATSLTLGTFPVGMGTVRDEQIGMVVVTDSTGLARSYLPTINGFDLVGQVLTVSGAAFAPDDKGYDVFIWGPPKSYDGTINGDDVRVLNPPAVDSLTGASLVIAYDHHEIHAGHSYHVGDVQAIDTSTQHWVVTAPDTLVHGHMVFGVYATGEIQVTVTEGGDRTPATALPAINRNRNSSNTAGVTVHRGYTAGSTDGATTIWAIRVGSTSQGGNLSGSGAGRGQLEYTLKQDTQYIVAVQTWAAIHASLELDWYEHEDVGA